MGSHSVLSIIGNSGEGTRRAAIRRRVLMVATLATSTRETKVRIRDVSITGARVEGDELPPRGADVVLTRGSFQVFGRIVWSGPGAVGVQFAGEFTEESLMDSLRGLAEPHPQITYRRSGFGREIDPPRLSTGDGWLRNLPGRA